MNLGLTVIRFRNEEVYKNANQVLKKIDETIRNLKSSPLEVGGKRTEIDLLIAQLKETWEGDPWFGRNGTLLLSEVNEQMAFTKLHGQHSILELVWHMANWKAFAINRLQHGAVEDLTYFEEADWQELDHENTALWQQGLQKLEEAQQTFLSVLMTLNDDVLEENVKGGTYSNRKLITGIIHHDIYHLGQIAYIRKQLF